MQSPKTRLSILFNIRPIRLWAQSKAQAAEYFFCSTKGEDYTKKAHVLPHTPLTRSFVINKMGSLKLLVHVLMITFLLSASLGWTFLFQAAVRPLAKEISLFGTSKTRSNLNLVRHGVRRSAHGIHLYWTCFKAPSKVLETKSCGDQFGPSISFPCLWAKYFFFFVPVVEIDRSSCVHLAHTSWPDPQQLLLM